MGTLPQYGGLGHSDIGQSSILKSGLTQLVSLDPLSQGFITSLQDVLYSKEYANIVNSLQSDDSLQLINFLDKALDFVHVNGDLYCACLRDLRRICGITGRIPFSYSITDELVVDRSLIAVAVGGFSRIWTGLYRGQKVAVKSLKISLLNKQEDICKTFCKEVVVWKRLSHPNILCPYGVSTNMPYELNMVFEWMAHSDICKYLERKADADRYSLLLDILEGLQYLHSCGVVHGDLRGSNVLIDDKGRARLVDFGLASIISDKYTPNIWSVKLESGITRWMAPELLPKDIGDIKDPDNFIIPAIRPSKESDVYAFAMVVVEVLTGKVPFHPSSNKIVPLVVRLGERPGKPEPVSGLGLSDNMWEMVRECWQMDSIQRPEISDVLGCFNAALPKLAMKRIHSHPKQDFPELVQENKLGGRGTPPPIILSKQVKTGANTQVEAQGEAVDQGNWLTHLVSLSPQSKDFVASLHGVLYSEEYVDLIDSLKGEESSKFINFLDKALDNILTNTELYHKCLRRLKKICGREAMLPSSYLIPDELLRKKRLFLTTTEGLSEVWTGRYKGQRVLMKYIQINPEDNSEDIHKAFYKQVVVWKRLSHRNIVPLLKVSITPDRLCMVFDRVMHSSIHKYLKIKPEANRYALLLDILEGLYYLHSCEVVYGDLRGSNILVNDGGRALLTDIGFSYTAGGKGPFDAWVIQRQRAKTRWTAPELFNTEIDNPATSIIDNPSTESDIYAFSMVVVEVLTDNIPFHEWRDEATVQSRVFKGERPEKPEPVTGLGLSDSMWKIVQKCWQEDATQRPEISDVLDCFKAAESERANDGTRSRPERNLTDAAANGGDPRGVSTTPSNKPKEFRDTVKRRQLSNTLNVPGKAQPNLPMGAPYENGVPKQPGFTLSSISLTQIVSLDPQSQNLFPYLRCVLGKQEDYDNFIGKLQDNECLQFINFLDKVLDNLAGTDLYRPCLLALRKTCGIKGQLPTSYSIAHDLLTGKSSHSVAGGGFSDVYSGFHKDRQVAMKYIRISQVDKPENLHKEFCKEVIVWRRLSHANIVPFLGVSINMPYQLCMVSDWMIHSHVRKYLENHPGANRDSLLLDVLKGLQYLHSCEIVHGDLKGLNILVDNGKRARLVDFGLASVNSDDYSVNASSVKLDRGTMRWMAPELFPKLSGDLLDPNNVYMPGVSHPTKECDIYAFAMVVIEVITGKIPFPALRNDVIPRLIEAGHRPERPVTGHRLLNSVWETVKACWQEDPMRRPKLSAIWDCFNTAALERAREDVLSVP